MRFFQAFSLLHRRTKSETFAAGYIPPTEGAVTNLNSRPDRPTSLPAGLGSNKEDISSVFDFAIAKFTPLSANFNHLNHAVSPHQRIAGNSQNGGSSSHLVEENMRLRDSLNLWFSEYSKADQLLQECRAELAFERDKYRTLQGQTTRDQELITDMKKDLSRYEKRFENSRGPDSTNQCSRVAIGSHNTLLLPGSYDSATSLAISTKIRTLDEYTSALRMTLSTRRQLRDQSKVTKFWKNVALSTGKCEDIITPSTSAISSIHGTLPPERKRAIDALMQERGWPYPQVQPAGPKTLVDSCSSDLPSKVSLSGNLSLSRIHPVSSIATTLQSTSSNNSVGSRLAPLASESLKTEINLLFGIQSSVKPSPPKKYRSPVLSSTPSKTLGESPSRLGNILKVNNLTFSFGSYGDLSQRFSVRFTPSSVIHPIRQYELQNLFSQSRTPRVKLPVAGAKDDYSINNFNPEPITELQPQLPSTCMDSSATSGPSRIFSESLGLLHHDTTDTDFNFHPVEIDKEEINPLKSGRSWQKHLIPAAKRVPSKIALRMPKKKVFSGKENVVVFSKPSSSKVQKPLFAKE